MWDISTAGDSRAFDTMPSPVILVPIAISCVGFVRATDSTVPITTRFSSAAVSIVSFFHCVVDTPDVTGNETFCVAAARDRPVCI